MELISTLVEVAGSLADKKDATGSAAYDFAYVFVKPWINIADGASQLLGMFA